MSEKVSTGYLVLRKLDIELTSIGLPFINDMGLIVLNGSITAKKGFQGVSVYGTVGQRFAPSLDPGPMNFASVGHNRICQIEQRRPLTSNKRE